MTAKKRTPFVWQVCATCQTKCKGRLCGRCNKRERNRLMCLYCRTARRVTRSYCAACREIVNRMTGERSRVGYATTERIAYLQARAAAGLPLFD